jgi:hypothetical protein
MIPAAARPIDLKERQYTGDIEAGTQLITIGSPFDGALKTPRGHRVLHPHKFGVPYDPDVPKPQVKSKYKSTDYLLYSYVNHQAGVCPHGYSGGPVWSFHDVDSKAIWWAKPMILGIVIKYFGPSNLIGAVRIQHLIALLETDTAL